MNEFIYLRPATKEEKPTKTNKGYSWWKCTCGREVLKRNDTIPKVCNCKLKRGLNHVKNETKNEILAFYKSKPMTIKEVADKFKYSQPTIEKILNEFNCDRWKRNMLFSENFQEDYFETIDTEEKAYFLGLLLTDGNIYHDRTNRQDRISIMLQKQDQYMIEKFAEEIKTNKKICISREKESQLQVLSNKMAQDLKELGVIPNKTFVTHLPTISNDLMPHLLRGIVDGDGSIGFYENKRSKKGHIKCVTICSASKDFLVEIRDFLSGEIGCSKISVYRQKENLWTIRYSSHNDLDLVLNYIYQDATCFLIRKKIKRDLILKEIGKYRDNQAS